MTEQERQREAAARLDRQREERQRSEDSQRQEEERRRQEQRQQDERRRKESQGKEISQRQEAQRGQDGDIHEATARTLQDKGRSASEKRIIETAQKRGVPIAPANLSMSGRSQSRLPQEPEQGKPDSPAVERLKAKMEQIKAQTKAQDKVKSQGMEHDRG